MEEKDINIIEDFIVIYEDDKLETDFIADVEQFKAIQKLLKAYKQDEKIIHEMAKAMEDEHCSIGDIVNEEICDHKRCIGTAMQCRDCIIDYFRKDCE